MTPKLIMSDHEADNGQIDDKLFQIVRLLPSDILNQRDQIWDRMDTAGKDLDPSHEITADDLDESIRLLVFALGQHVLSFRTPDSSETNLIFDGYEMTDRLHIDPVNGSEQYLHGAYIEAISKALATATGEIIDAQIEYRSAKSIQAAIAFQAVAIEASKRLVGIVVQPTDEATTIYDSNVHRFSSTVFPVHAETVEVALPIPIPVETVADKPANQSGEKLAHLNNRQLQILDQVRKGVINYRSIAKNLSLAPITIAGYLTHLRKIVGKDLSAAALRYFPSEPGNAADTAADIAKRPATEQNPLNTQTLLSFTPRERDIFSRLGEGKSDREIAKEFGIAYGTVKTSIKKMREKIGLGHRSELVALAVANPTASVQPAAEIEGTLTEYKIRPHKKRSRVLFVTPEGSQYTRDFTHADKLLYVPFAVVFQACVDQGFVPSRTSAKIAQAVPMRSSTSLKIAYRRHGSGIFNVDRSTGFSSRIPPEELRRIIESSGRMTVQLDSDSWAETQKGLKVLKPGEPLEPFTGVVVDRSSTRTAPARKAKSGRTENTDAPTGLEALPSLTGRERSVIEAARNGAITARQFAEATNIPRGSIFSIIHILEARTGLKIGDIAEKYGKENTQATTPSDGQTRTSSIENLAKEELPMTPEGLPALTPRERDVLMKIGSGLKTDKEIALSLKTTPGNVGYYKGALRNKVGRDLPAAALQYGYGPSADVASPEGIAQPAEAIATSIPPEKPGIPDNLPNPRPIEKALFELMGTGIYDVNELARRLKKEPNNVSAIIAGMRNKYGNLKVATERLGFGSDLIQPAGIPPASEGVQAENAPPVQRPLNRGTSKPEGSPTTPHLSANAQKVLTEYVGGTTSSREISRTTGIPISEVVDIANHMRVRFGTSDLVDVAKIFNLVPKPVTATASKGEAGTAGEVVDFNTLPEAEWDIELLKKLGNLLESALLYETKVTDPRQNHQRVGLQFQRFPEYYRDNPNETMRLLDAIALPLEGITLRALLDDQPHLAHDASMILAIIALEKKTRSLPRPDITTVKRQILRVMHRASKTDAEIDQMAQKPFEDIARALAKRIDQA